MKKPVLTLGIILIIQLIIYGVVSTDTHRVETKEKFLAVDTSRINFVHIENNDGKITLKRVGNQWKITEPYDYPANPNYINTLLQKVNELELESYITDNPEKYNQYELGDTAVYVEIGREGEVIDKFYSGKASKTYTHTYVRRADSDEVWLVSGMPRSSFDRKPSDWRNKKILTLDNTMIEKVVITFPDEQVELIRAISSPVVDTTLIEPDTTWQIVPSRGKPFTPDDKQLNRVLNTLGRLNAVKFWGDTEEETEPPSFDNPEFSIDVHLEGNQHERVEFVPQPDDENRWIARKKGVESTLFIVYKSSVNNLKKRADDFKPEPEDKES